MEGRDPGRRPLLLCLALTLSVYALGINPFLLPDTYDNALYHHAARALAEGRGYTFQGAPVADWPPGFSLVLAIPQLAGADSVVVAKLVVLLFVAAGLILAWRLLRAYGRPHPLLVCALFAALPKAYQMGTRVMAEWPFIAASLAFLLLLHRLGGAPAAAAEHPGAAGERSTRLAPGSLWLALLTGVALGVAALTRYTGVLLGAAVVAQAIAALRRRRELQLWRRVLPELVVAGVGAALFFGWAVWVLAHQGAAEPATVNLDGSRYGGVHPGATLRAVANLLFFSQGALNALGSDSAALAWVLALPGLLVLVGLGARLFAGRGHAADAYVLALFLFVSVYEDGNVPTVTRYLLPVAPLLLADFLEGGRVLMERLVSPLAQPWQWRPVRAAAGLWLLALVAMNGYALARGGRSHRGLAGLVSADTASFYTGYWRDLYLACRYLNAEPGPGLVAQVGRIDDKYIVQFTGRRVVRLDALTTPGFVLVVEPERLSEQALRQHGLVERRRFGSVRVYATGGQSTARGD